jgi:hypothetical protein
MQFAQDIHRLQSRLLQESRVNTAVVRRDGTNSPVLAKCKKAIKLSPSISLRAINEQPKSSIQIPYVMVVFRKISIQYHKPFPPLHEKSYLPSVLEKSYSWTK